MNKFKLLKGLFASQIFLFLFITVSQASGFDISLCDCAGEDAQIIFFPESESDSEGLSCESLDYKNIKARNIESPILLDWEGTYEGGHPGFFIRRNMEMHIDPFRRTDGETRIDGTIKLSPYPGDSHSVYDGAYKFSGTYNSNTKEIIVQGHTWISFPVDGNGSRAGSWDFFVFTGTVNANTIRGINTIDGAWDLSAMNVPEEEWDSGFVKGIDNNSFDNHNSDFFGFWDRESYKMSEEFFNKLVSYGYPEKALKIKMDSDWRGACYGISATMALVFMRKMTVFAISREDAYCYFKMQKPKDNEYLRDVLHYYHLTQSLNQNGEESLCENRTFQHDLFSNQRNASFKNVSLSTFLSRLLVDAKDAAKKKEVLMLNYKYAEGGHSILVTGYKFKGGKYELKLYDMNHFKMIKMTIPMDCCEFKFVDGNRSRISHETFHYMSYIKPDKFRNVVKAKKDNKINGSENYTFLSFSYDDSFELKSSTGYSLNYENEKFSGDLPILSLNYTDNDVKLKTKYCSSFEIKPKSKNTKILIYDNYNCKGIEGKNIEAIIISLPGNIKLNGKSYTFKAYTSVDEMLDERESGLGSIYAKGKGEVIIHKGQDTIEAISDNTMSHVETKIYQGVDVIKGTIKGKQKSVVIKPCEETIGTSTSIEDGIIIFSKQGYAYRGRPIKPFVSVYVGGKSLKKNKEFKVQYENNADVGTGKLTVTGVGEYTGSLTAEFPIIPKKVKMKKVSSCKSGFEVTWNSSGPKDGFEIQYDTDPDFKKAKTKKIEDSEASSAQVEGLVVGTEYFVRIRAYKTETETGKTYNSNWSDVRSVLIYPY